jgi:hypothetical protein
MIIPVQLQPRSYANATELGSLADRLVLLNSPYLSFDHIKRRRISTSGKTNNILNGYLGANFSGTSSGLNYGSTRIIPGGSSTHTVLVFGCPQATGRGHMFSQAYQVSPYPQTMLGYGVDSLGNANNGCITFYDFGGSTVATSAGATTGSSTATGAPLVMVGVRNGANAKIYLNGIDKTSSANGDGSTINNSNQSLTIGNDAGYSSSDRASVGNIFLVAVWTRALSAYEIRLVSLNPWRLFSNNIFDFSRLSQIINLSGNGVIYNTASGELKSDISINGASVIIATAEGAISQNIGLDGSSASISSADGIINLSVTLLGDGSIEPIGIGNVSLSISLLGSSLSEVLASADLNPGQGLQGGAQVLSSVTGDLTLDIPIISDAIISVTGNGGLSNEVPLSGVSATISSITGDLGIEVQGLNGLSIIEFLAAGNITINLSLSASALINSTTIAFLSIAENPLNNNRYYKILEQNRIFNIIEQNRILAIASQNRNYSILEQNRRYLI